MDDRRRYARGLSVRRKVLGGAHVDEALRRRTAFSHDFQDLLTRYAWGEIWTRPGLPRATRSLVTIAALIALHRTEELRMHLRAALRNGVPRGQIKEVLLQMAIYCGVPAANSAFQIAAEVFAEHGARAAGRKPRRRRPRRRAKGYARGRR
jgi:4-carboxymuconolactone decarboxylase